MLFVNALIFLGSVWAARWLWNVGSREPGLPPGPPTKPLIGNVLDFPTRAIYKRFAEWASIYGDIVSLKIGFSSVIIISSPEMVRQLLDKRSITTANRPPLHFNELVTDDHNVGFAPFGTRYKNMRRALLTLLSREACIEHLPIKQAEASQLMYDLLKQPEAYFTHVERFSVSTIFSIVFGVRCPRHESPLVQTFFRLEEEWEDRIAPGHQPPVDMISFLRYVPERWAPWKAICRDLRARQQDLWIGLMQSCENRMQREAHNGSFIEHLLQEQEKYGLTRKEVAFLGSGLIQGGSITTTAFLRTMICCLATHTDVQARAHDEIDRIIGSGRMPTIEDVQHLPYLQAIIKEVHRFCPSVPYALPHYSTAEETIGAYTIPKNSTIFMNIYGIYHDEDAYTQPNVFMPERFLKTEFGTTPGADNTSRRNDMHFGAGRRICPGMLLGNNSTATLYLIWGFDFKVAKDPQTGLEKPTDPNEFTEGFVISCAKFPADIRPRSEVHSSMIRAQYSSSRAFLRHFEQELPSEDQAFVDTW
ncbi:hypothetical protein EIP91_004264 [Steccherinum ochraceum]|uniref:Cytochrome P450 n=1 Tax=Steccherinum ochraceum TaxID=92696 RepID=A0A4V2MVZ3_9APHY|nr:hypothetical protein EIP91_004264 [Steccherinum ochraceum]